MKLIYKDGETVETAIDGVTFVCRAPVGQVENDLADGFDSFSANPDGAGQHKINRACRDNFVDTILVGWRGDGVPEFPKKPSTVLISGVKIKLMVWYQGLMIIEDEDSKN